MVCCDFCGERAAILYCRADSAKLCLSCDQHVHAANALSKKHLRSQICDNCAAEPAAVRCATDGLVLCQECDWDAHGSCAVSAAHCRCPLDPFSGCPSPLDLAANWGLDIDEKKPPPPAYDWGGLLDELMVPNAVFSDCGGGGGGEEVVKRKVSSCGKQKQVILKQLMELVADGGGGCGGEVGGPRTPSGGGGWRPEEDLCGGGYEEQPPRGEERKGMEQGGGFTSLLMMQTAGNPKEEDNVWNTSTSDHGTQIWDFNLGQLRGHEESGTLELEYAGNDMEFTGKSYGELLKEVSLAKRRVVDLPGVNSYNENMIPFNTPSQGPATSESNNIPVSRQSSCSVFNKPKNYGGSKDFQLIDQSVLLKSENVPAEITKADMELLAKNRGNAMQRYKEKKKTRRYDKHIRYESRKARADTRKRVKGRFVKANEAPAG